MSATVEEAREIQVLLAGRNVTLTKIHDEVSADTGLPTLATSLDTKLKSGRGAVECVLAVELGTATSVTIQPYLYYEAIDAFFAIDGGQRTITENWTQIVRCGPGQRVALRVVSTDGTVSVWLGVPDVS